MILPLSLLAFGLQASALTASNSTQTASRNGISSSTSRATTSQVSRVGQRTLTTTTRTTVSFSTSTSRAISPSSSPRSTAMATTTRPATTSSIPAKPTAVSSTPSNTTNSSIPTLESRSLKGHNVERFNHNATALAWNTTLVAAAQSWANKCVFKHSGGAVGPYGENLAAFANGNRDTISDGIQLWNDEAPDYNPSSPQYSHWTQVVWKGTKQVGCAVASCAPGTIFPSQYGASNYYVCEYFPPGNYIGQFGANVQK